MAELMGDGREMRWRLLQVMDRRWESMVDVLAGHQTLVVRGGEDGSI